MRNNYLDVLKFLAIFTMLIDHIAYLLLPSDLIVAHHMRGIGRLAMPLFFAVHGYLLIKSTHLPSPSRIAKFALYGVFFTVCAYFIPVDDHFTSNVLLQFFVIELVHRLNHAMQLRPLTLPVLLAVLFSILNLTTDFEKVFAAGVYPLLYGLSGMILALATPFAQKLAILLLVIGLSFEFNFFIILFFLYTTDASFVFYLLPTLCIPFLFWYIPKAKDIQLPTLYPIVSAISRNAIYIYIIHFQLLYIAHLIFVDKIHNKLF